MESTHDPIDAILAACGFRGPWKPLVATGIVNRIYATEEVVIRVAGDHPEAVNDARTESVAAPVAHAAGILIPKLLVFDDSRELMDRPYSIWERVDGQTLGCMTTDPHATPNTWLQVGRQLALLHTRVGRCDDPQGYLDEPERNGNLRALVEELAEGGRLQGGLAKEVLLLVDELSPYVQGGAEVCFLHNDIHAMNLMCTCDDELKAVLDWGDAGWGDPTIEFAQIPLWAVPYVLTGYREVAPDLLGVSLEARIVWDKLDYAMEELARDPSHGIPLGEFQRFLDTGSG